VAEKPHRKNNAALSFFYQLIVFNHRIRKQIATKFVQTRPPRRRRRARGQSPGICQSGHFSPRAFRDAALLPAQPRLVGRATAAFWHHHHFGFHLFNLREQRRHDNVLLAQEISFKARLAALVVAADGSASHHADARAPRRAEWVVSPKAA